MRDEQERAREAGDVCGRGRQRRLRRVAAPGRRRETGLTGGPYLSVSREGGGNAGCRLLGLGLELAQLARGEGEGLGRWPNKEKGRKKRKRKTKLISRALLNACAPF